MGWRDDALRDGIDQNSPQFAEQRAAEASGGGGGSGSDKTAPAFKFDWDAARKATFDPDNPSSSVLGRYYLQKLKDAGDDVTRAKRLIQEDYDRGVRVATEDYTRAEKYGQEDLTSQLKEFDLDKTAETRETYAGANQRGTLLGEIAPNSESSKAPISDYAKTYITEPMEQRQDLRKQAIERAIKRQTEVAGVSKTRDTEAAGITKFRGIEEQDTAYPREKSRLEEETRKEAYNTTVPQQYTEQYQKYRVSQNLPER